MSPAFPKPQGGASLLLSFRLQSRTTLILGSGPLAASRAFAALEADSAVTVIAKGGVASACEELQWRARQKQLIVLDWDALPQSSEGASDEESSLECYLSTASATSPQGQNISFVCITDTVLGTPERRSRASAERIYRLCRARNIPVNTTDVPDLCDFSFAAAHRFEDAVSGARTALQVGVTTNGQGCRLGSRVKREIVSLLSKDLGAAVDRVGTMRSLARTDALEEDEYESEDSGVATPNQPVPPRSPTETEAEHASRRMKWVAQVSEYWPLSRLAAMSEQEMREVLAGEHSTSPTDLSALLPASLHGLDVRQKGRILLVGSGPGHPSLLTLATHTALTQLADLVLSDKLVPAAVLALIPQTVQVRIAKKFPGNAEGAQNEMMEAAVEAAQRGLTVIRLKQGDPVVYGRAGEEVLYFRAHGFEPVVIPGVSAALAGPTFAGIPVTQRGVAETFSVCTGVGRNGKDVQLPGYERARTLVVLMGVARLPQVVAALLDPRQEGRRTGEVYPPHLPIAIVERASMPDQRVLVSTLRDVVTALESLGEQRPPGIMVIGWAVLALWGTGDVDVLEDGVENDDEGRVGRWLGDGVGWRVKEGLPDGWDAFNP
ncbi:uroporphyrin-III C-methyltransferase [Mycena albidolilacea]|uniref:precorrin-2 dehydrogenase n=1 Tax=Mycena albidolilacea TaxID=1033008 RepID=A0AAD7EZG1_9AGAR|nr:uroporphyrin-III C-methyltransferase [Mycena albidolilacea]